MFFIVFIWCRDAQVLSASQNEFVKETEVKVYKLLEETPPNGKAFAQTVRHMLKREELWNNWKNEGCKGSSIDCKFYQIFHAHYIFINYFRIQKTRAAS